MLTKIHGYIHQFEKNLWVLSFGWFVAALGFAVSIPFIAIYFHSSLGLSLSEIGIFFGALAIIRSVFQAVGGEMSDRMERRQLLLYSQFIRSIAFLLLAFCIFYDLGFWAVALMLSINSIFGAIFHPVANAMVSDILPSEKRLDGYAITRAAGNLGWAVGPAIGGFLAHQSYGLLFVISAVVTFLSSMIFLFYLRNPKTSQITDKFKFSDLISVKDDPFLFRHSMLIFVLYLVIAQFFAPFSVYTVDMVGISEAQLGWIYTVNGVFVVALQIPITRLLAKKKFTTQLAMGSFVFLFGYSMIGFFAGFEFFIMAMIIITFGEMFMSPPSLALTSRLAPEGRMGRYMGIFGFFMASGWSFGPLYGGIILDYYGHQPELAWILISSLALVSGFGYISFARKLPKHLNYKE
jgi:MFS family permease